MTEATETKIDNPFDAGRARRLDIARTTLPTDLVDRFERGMFRTDALADAVVEDFAEMGRGRCWPLLERALRERRADVAGAPRSLRTLLGPLLEPPPWFDAEQVRRGAAVWWRFAPAAVLALAAALLAVIEFGDLNKPQALNGRSARMSGRRYEETARWLMAATEPGAAAPGGAGFDATVRVRLVHAMVRRHLRRSGRWDETAWGAPIHASGQSVVNLAFMLTPLATYDALHMTLTDEETESVRRLWYWLGYVMGVPGELLPVTMEHAWQTRRAGNLIFAPPDHDSIELVHALKHDGIRAERRLPKRLQPALAPILRPAVSGAVWGLSDAIIKKTLVTDSITAKGGMPSDYPGSTHIALAALRPALAVWERLRHRGTLGTDLDIARRERAHVALVLSSIKAVPHPVRPEDAVTELP
ncbi:oxygenase MpaB family protein [Nocardia wallacei]|uniref:oxygenase MpaB family protein n=1 Tax=Nocardia wallacei TaxID=480035 RepID=UPI002455C4D7|nr:oxygenase MpaB family protein [Nocardia wallacei]